MCIVGSENILLSCFQYLKLIQVVAVLFKCHLPPQRTLPSTNHYNSMLFYIIQWIFKRVYLFLFIKAGARQWRARLMTVPTHELPSRKVEGIQVVRMYAF